MSDTITTFSPIVSEVSRLVVALWAVNHEDALLRDFTLPDDDVIADYTRLAEHVWHGAGSYQIVFDEPVDAMLSVTYEAKSVAQLAGYLSSWWETPFGVALSE